MGRGGSFTLDVSQGSTEDAAAALRAFGVEAGPDSEQAMTEVAKLVKLQAMASLKSAPGRGWSRSQTKLRAQREKVTLVAPWAVGAEVGAKTHMVFGRRRSVNMSTMMRSLWGRRVAWEDGYILGAAWARLRKQMTDLAADRMQDELGGELDKRGVRKAA
jgi:hypothetical protein